MDLELNHGLVIFNFIMLLMDLTRGRSFLAYPTLLHEILRRKGSFSLWIIETRQSPIEVQMLQYLIINSYSNMKCILFISNSALYFACGERNSYCNLFITIHSGWKISWHFLKAFLFLVNEYNAFTNHKTNPNNTRGNAA
jgi:hypothetical protein